MAAEKSSNVANGAATKKENPPVKLLRKPLAPKPPQSLETSPPLKPNNQEILHAGNPQYAFYPPAVQHDFGTPEPSFSPPPPTESHSRPQSETYKNHSGLSTRKAQRNRKDLRYHLDSSYRQRTSLGTYVEGHALVKPYKPRGPDALPFRPPKQNPVIMVGPIDEDEMRYYQRPEFTLQDFTLKMAESEKVPIEKVQTAMFSKHTYKKLQKLLVEQCLPVCTEVSTVQLELADDIPNVTPRIPHQQLLLEMAALVKEQMSGVVDANMKAVIRPLPRYSPSYKPDGSHPHTEILLYEDHKKEKSRQLSALRQEGEMPGHDSIFHGGPPRYFQGSRRSNSPFAAADEGLISPSELAVLDSIMSGGVALSLKAHFISQLPDIEPLSRTITYLNLSFNDFRYIPVEIFNISQLTVLKLRNNPIKDLPDEIGMLKNLRVLVMSFCLITTLPISLFHLVKLEKLDVAYNKIIFIPQEIRKLKRLRELNLEGNQLPAMPAGALRLPHLKYVRVRNNFMHPLFWKENTKIEPQRLMDMAALMLTQTGLYRHYQDLPEHIATFLELHGQCDLCRGPLYGPGLRIIRPVSKIFNVKNLPFLFRCCSNHCVNMFNDNSDALTEMLYGTKVAETKNPKTENET